MNPTSRSIWSLAWPQMLAMLFLCLIGLSDVWAAGTYILSIYLYTLPAYFLLISGNAVFRALRQTRITFWAMLTVAILNLWGNLALGLGYWNFPASGYKGLAWSTFFSVLCGASLVLYFLNQRGLLKKSLFVFDRWSRTALPYLLRVAWPMALNQVLWYASFFALFATASALPHGSVQAMAGMSAGMRIESILYLPAFALGLTSSVITGSSLHTLNVHQLRRMAYKIMLLGLGVICLPAAMLWFAAGPLSGLMTTDAQTAAEAASFLRFSLCAMPFLVVYMTLSGAMAGAGATIYQLPAMAGSAWLVRIPLAWHLGHVYLKESTGIWWAILISLIIQALFMFYLFQSRNWPACALGSRSKSRTSSQNRRSEFDTGFAEGSGRRQPA